MLDGATFEKNKRKEPRCPIDPCWMFAPNRQHITTLEQFSQLVRQPDFVIVTPLWLAAFSSGVRPAVFA